MLDFSKKYFLSCGLDLSSIIYMVSKFYSSAIDDRRVAPSILLGVDTGTLDCISEMNVYKLFHKLFMER